MVVADPLQQGEIVHVASAHLKYIGVLCHEGQRLGILRFRHNEKSISGCSLTEIFGSLDFQTLESVGRGSRFERTASEKLHPLLFQYVSDLKDLFLTFN